MLTDLKDINKIRKKLGITQKQLADLSGVSQSLIAKIESGILDPSFSNSQKIFYALKSASKSKEKQAKNVMEKKVIFVKSDSKVNNAIKLMRKYEISQIPVIDNHKPVGYLSESIILNALIEKKIEEVSEIMEDVPPTVSQDAPLDVVSELLKYYQMVLVQSKGKVIGVVSRADVIRNL